MKRGAFIYIFLTFAIFLSSVTIAYSPQEGEGEIKAPVITGLALLYNEDGSLSLGYSIGGGFILLFLVIFVLIFVLKKRKCPRVYTKRRKKRKKTNLR